MMRHLWRGGGGFDGSVPGRRRHSSVPHQLSSSSRAPANKRGGGKVFPQRESEGGWSSAEWRRWWRCFLTIPVRQCAPVTGDG
jgi:hypothetical protein